MPIAPASSPPPNSRPPRPSARRSRSAALAELEVRLALGVEGIAGGADGADEVGLVALVQCLAEAADVDVDGAHVDLRIVRPDRIEQPFAREDAPGMLHQMAQEAEFGRPE